MSVSASEFVPSSLPPSLQCVSAGDARQVALFCHMWRAENEAYQRRQSSSTNDDHSGVDNNEGIRGGREGRKASAAVVDVGAIGWAGVANVLTAALARRRTCLRSPCQCADCLHYAAANAKAALYTAPVINTEAVGKLNMGPAHGATAASAQRRQHPFSPSTEDPSSSSSPSVAVVADKPVFSHSSLFSEVGPQRRFVLATGGGLASLSRDVGDLQTETEAAVGAALSSSAVTANSPSASHSHDPSGGTSFSSKRRPPSPMRASTLALLSSSLPLASVGGAPRAASAAGGRGGAAPINAPFASASFVNRKTAVMHQQATAARRNALAAARQQQQQQKVIASAAAANMRKENTAEAHTTAGAGWGGRDYGGENEDLYRPDISFHPKTASLPPPPAPDPFSLTNVPEGALPFVNPSLHHNRPFGLLSFTPRVAAMAGGNGGAGGGGGGATLGADIVGCAARDICWHQQLVAHQHALASMAGAAKASLSSRSIIGGGKGEEGNAPPTTISSLYSLFSLYSGGGCGYPSTDQQQQQQQHHYHSSRRALDDSVGARLCFGGVTAATEWILKDLDEATHSNNKSFDSICSAGNERRLSGAPTAETDSYDAVHSPTLPPARLVINGYRQPPRRSAVLSSSLAATAGVSPDAMRRAAAEASAEAAEELLLGNVCDSLTRFVFDAEVPMMHCSPEEGQRSDMEGEEGDPCRSLQQLAESLGAYHAWASRCFAAGEDPPAGHRQQQRRHEEEEADDGMQQEEDTEEGEEKKEAPQFAAAFPRGLERLLSPIANAYRPTSVALWDSRDHPFAALPSGGPHIVKPGTMGLGGRPVVASDAVTAHILLSAAPQLSRLRSVINEEEGCGNGGASRRDADRTSRSQLLPIAAPAASRLTELCIGCCIASRALLLAAAAACPQLTVLVLDGVGRWADLAPAGVFYLEASKEETFVLENSSEAETEERPNGGVCQYCRAQRDTAEEGDGRRTPPPPREGIASERSPHSSSGGGQTMRAVEEAAAEVMKGEEKELKESWDDDSEEGSEEDVDSEKESVNVDVKSLRCECPKRRSGGGEQRLYGGRRVGSGVAARVRCYLPPLAHYEKEGKDINTDMFGRECRGSSGADRSCYQSETATNDSEAVTERNTRRGINDVSIPSSPWLLLAALLGLGGRLRKKRPSSARAAALLGFSPPPLKTLIISNISGAFAGPSSVASSSAFAVFADAVAASPTLEHLALASVGVGNAELTAFWEAAMSADSLKEGMRESVEGQHSPHQTTVAVRGFRSLSHLGLAGNKIGQLGLENIATLTSNASDEERAKAKRENEEGRVEKVSRGGGRRGTVIVRTISSIDLSLNAATMSTVDGTVLAHCIATALAPPPLPPFASEASSSSLSTKSPIPSGCAAVNSGDEVAAGGIGLSLRHSNIPSGELAKFLRTFRRLAPSSRHLLSHFAFSSAAVFGGKSIDAAAFRMLTDCFAVPAPSVGLTAKLLLAAPLSSHLNSLDLSFVDLALSTSHHSAASAGTSSSSSSAAAAAASAAAAAAFPTTHPFFTLVLPPLLPHLSRLRLASCSLTDEACSRLSGAFDRALAVMAVSHAAAVSSASGGGVPVSDNGGGGGSGAAVEEETREEAQRREKQSAWVLQQQQKKRLKEESKKAGGKKSGKTQNAVEGTSGASNTAATTVSAVSTNSGADSLFSEQKVALFLPLAELRLDGNPFGVEGLRNVAKATRGQTCPLLTHLGLSFIAGAAGGNSGGPSSASPSSGGGSYMFRDSSSQLNSSAAAVLRHMAAQLSPSHLTILDLSGSGSIISQLPFAEEVMRLFSNERARLWEARVRGAAASNANARVLAAAGEGRGADGGGGELTPSPPVTVLPQRPPSLSIVLRNIDSNWAADLVHDPRFCLPFAHCIFS